MQRRFDSASLGRYSLVMRFQHLLAVSVLSFATGCIPVPLLVPPTKVDIGVAAKGSDEGITATFPIRAGVHFLQLDELGYFREFDVAPGWSIFPATNGEFLHGPFLEGGLLFPIEEGPRWGTNLKIHYLFPSEEKPHGIATTLQGTVEWADWSDGIFSECDTSDGCATGVSYGEASIGLFVEFGVSHFPGDRRQFWGGGGLLFRIPLTVGFALVPVWELDD